MRALYSLWCWTVGVVATLVFGTLAILTSWVPPRGRVYLFWARAWARVVIAGCGFPVRIEVDPEARRTSAAILMANHESVLDIFVLLAAVPQDVRFLAKRSLFQIPVLGWSMWLGGFIPVDRDRADSAREVFETLEKKLAEGVSVLIFPEGTRSRDGELLPFKKSGFLLALRTGAPIVPVGISGAHASLGRGAFALRRCPIHVRVGRPVPTEGLGVSRRAALMEEVRAAILAARSGRPARGDDRPEAEDRSGTGGR